MLDLPANVKWITKGSPSRGRRWAQSEAFPTCAVAVRFAVERLNGSGASNIAIYVADAPALSDWQEIAGIYQGLQEERT
jgi:hypothetical protein